jgi:outer membrane protein assembly factor BamA
MHRATGLTALLVPLLATAAGDELPEAEMLEAEGFFIGAVTLDKADVFDLSDPEENKWLYRVANRYHIITLDKTIAKQLLFEPGDKFDQRVIEESERILRRNKYLYDASIEPVRAADGKVDLVVSTRDVWSLSPELSVSRTGGETRTRIGLEEFNLLGRGQRLRILRDDDVDRTETAIEFSDQHLGRSWVSFLAQYSDNSDGRSSTLSAIRPFHELDARWSAGTVLRIDDRFDKIYQYGEPAAEYEHERDYAWIFGGWSQGLTRGKVRRWTAGLVYDFNRFGPAENVTLANVVPEDRELVYPYLGFELVEDGFVEASNHDQIDRTEDFQMGLQVRASLGWADTAYGSDRDAAIFSMSASDGFGSLDKTALLLSASTRGRLESGDLANTLLSFDAHFYHRHSEKRTFYAAISGTVGESLDLDNLVEIGGDTGLRGYPLRYQVGESKALATIEQRYYTDWYPFRLARVGGAVFADVGRVWGPNPLGPDNRGWLTDVGFGLRLAVTRISSGRVVHIDVAFPLNGDPDIDNVQFLIESKRSF